MGTNFCTTSKLTEEEIRLSRSSCIPQKQKKVIFVKYIQRIWRKFKSLKISYKEKLNFTIHLLNTKSGLNNEFVSLQEMNCKTNKIVLDIESKLVKFTPTPEIHYFPFSFLREPVRLSDGSIYHGYWNIEGLNHGYGILIREQGSKYEGFFENDKLSGRGRFIDSQGAFYYEGL